MKILVICQYYYPEPVRIFDICEELVRLGHEVDVVTGVPNYPMGRIYDGYKGKKKKNEIINGVNVHRCFTVARRTGTLFRILNYYSFAFSSTRYLARCKKKYDAVFVNQLSPVMMACAGIKYKSKHSDVKLIYYCLDLWPESLVAGGIKRGSAVYRLFNKISKNIYEKADKILVTSRDFVDYFKTQFALDENKLSYLPQYAEDIFVPVQAEQKNTVELTFAGNIGAAQSVETIIKAADRLKSNSNLKFNIVGDGSALSDCKRLAESLKLDNVIFHGRKPLEEMPGFYQSSDAMLVTLSNDELISKTLPGKVQTYMAAGKPIIGAINGEAAKVIEESKCGLCGPAEDDMILADNISKFLTSDQSLMGKNSREYYEKNFTRNSFFETLVCELSRQNKIHEKV